MSTMYHPRPRKRVSLLAKRAEQRFAWHWQQVHVAGKQVRLAVASDPDGMLIDACERQDAGEKGVIDPFWATTWRAAAGLDRYLDRLQLEGQRVLEVGCGTGQLTNFLGIGHRRVIGTDMCLNSLRLGESFRHEHDLWRVRFMQMNPSSSKGT